MQAIIDFFVTIGEVVTSIIDFVVKFFMDLVYIIGLLGQTIAALPAMIGWLPSACISLVIATFTIVVIYKIMGREG